MKRTIGGWVLLAIVACLAYCTSKNEYTNAIPKDASVVVSLDLKSMAAKGGIDGKDGEKVVEKLTAARKSGLEGEAYKAMEKIIQKPSESGLSFSDRVYLFATPHSGAFGLVAKVNSKGKVKSCLEALEKEQLCTAPKNESGCSWVQAGDALCAFNGGTFLVLTGGKGDIMDMKETLLAWMRQDATSSYAGTADYERLGAASGDITALVNLSVIPEELTMQWRMGVSADLNPDDIKYLFSVHFEKGKTVIDSETLVENKTLQALYEKQSAVMSPVKGTYLECFPASTLLWAGSHISGQEVYDLLCENPTIKQGLENPILPIDIESIFASIQGDIAVGYGSLASNAILAYADVTNSEFLQTFEELRPLLALTGGQMQLISAGKDRYELRMYRQSIWFGVKDGMFYLSNDGKLASEAGRRYGVSLRNAPWAGDVSDSRFFLLFNAAQLAEEMHEHPQMLYGTGVDGNMAELMLGLCDYVELAIPDWKNGQMNVVMKDKDLNLLQLLVRGLENV